MASFTDGLAKFGTGIYDGLSNVGTALFGSNGVTTHDILGNPINTTGATSGLFNTALGGLASYGSKGLNFLDTHQGATNALLTGGKYLMDKNAADKQQGLAEQYYASLQDDKKRAIDKENEFTGNVGSGFRNSGFRVG